ncbi:MAG: lysophospholipid acyltransferase family protein [Pseudomonadota bacterium]
MSLNKNKWDSKSHGTKFGHHFFYFVIRNGGRKVAYFFLYFIVFNYAVLFPSIRKKTDPYLQKRFFNAGFFERIKHRYLLILNFGRILIDRAIVGILGQESICALFEDYEKMKAIDSGFILLISHVGGWQVAMSALDVLEKPVNFLMLRHEKDIDKHYFEHNENGNSIKIIDPSQFLGGSIEILNALKKDEIVCMMGDRIFGDSERSIEMEFLNGKARFPFSAFKMSSISQKPIVVLYSHKDGPSQYQTRISAIIHVPPKLGKSTKRFRPYVEKFVSSLELFIQDYPYQFFNFYNMWIDDQKELNE